MPDISIADGKKIVAEAATWKGTPYALAGAHSEKGIKGDCSGTTYKICKAVGVSFDYIMAASYPGLIEKGLLRELQAHEKKQEGDFIWWSDHVAIYSSFATDSVNATTDRTNKLRQHYQQKNDMWTAFHSGGNPYGPWKITYFGKSTSPRFFRYQR